MGKIYVINVIHTEPDWWDGKLRGIDMGIPAFLDRLETMANTTGIRIPLTWCLYFGNDTGWPDLVDVRRAFFLERLAKGDEIGIHPHATDHRDQPNYFKANAEKLVAAGFPYPKTHAAGWFYLNEAVISRLEESGIEVDASLYAREGQFLHPDSGILLQDATCRGSRKAASFRPYHPDRKAVCQRGDSTVVEVPIFFPLGGKEDGWSCRAGVLTNSNDYVAAFAHHWAHRDEVAVDIVQFFWHPFDLLWVDDNDVAHADEKMIAGLCSIYARIAAFPDVEFATSAAAVTAWKSHHE